MRNDDEYAIFNLPQYFPSVFTIAGLRVFQTIGISKNIAGIIKAYAMFLAVAGVFLCVPFKVHYTGIP
ncbi:hypothetical protein BC440_10550 [Thalassospira sp. MIT1004]|nr:hypothetical protein BC440_10550 [Thalassospira sp. MIT1004]